MQKQCVGDKCLSSLAIQASRASCDTPWFQVGGAGPAVPINYSLYAFCCLVLTDKLLL